MLGAGGPQVARDLPADAAEAADDVVVAEGIDHLLYPALLEHAAELARDEELRHRREAVEERTYAEQLEADLERPAARCRWDRGSTRAW